MKEWLWHDGIFCIKKTDYYSYNPITKTGGPDKKKVEFISSNFLIYAYYASGERNWVQPEPEPEPDLTDFLFLLLVPESIFIETDPVGPVSTDSDST